MGHKENVFSDDLTRQLNSTQHFRRLLSIGRVSALLLTILSSTNTIFPAYSRVEKHPPIQQVIESGVVHRFVQFLQMHEHPVTPFPPPLAASILSISHLCVCIRLYNSRRHGPSPTSRRALPNIRDMWLMRAQYPSSSRCWARQTKTSGSRLHGPWATWLETVSNAETSCSLSALFLRYFKLARFVSLCLVSYQDIYIIELVVNIHRLSMRVLAFLPSGTRLGHSPTCAAVTPCPFVWIRLISLSDILFQGKPAPNFEIVRPALPLLARLLYASDMETVTDACWALSYISDGPNDRIQAVLNAGHLRDHGYLKN